ncbi:MAG: hypothetical protein P8Z73_13620 [Desulfobacteraceae bacterium]
MRAFNMKLSACFGALLILAMVINGCGSGSDLLDEVGGRTVVELSLTDGGDDGVHELDIVQTLDCNGDGTLDDPEDFFEVTGTISVAVAKDAPGVTMLSYVVNYYPIPGVDTVGVVQVPPDIPSKQAQFNSFDVASGGSNSDSIIVMTIDQKLAVANDIATVAAYSNVVTFLYNIEVVVTFQDYEGNTKNESLFVDVNLGNYDNCSSGE